MDVIVAPQDTFEDLPLIRAVWFHSLVQREAFLTYHVTVLEVSHMFSKHTVKWHYYYSMNRIAVSLKLLSSEKGSWLKKNQTHYKFLF